MNDAGAPDNSGHNSNDTRMMWIAAAVIVLILLGGMGINMLLHPDMGLGGTETSSPPQ